MLSFQRQKHDMMLIQEIKCRKVFVHSADSDWCIILCMNNGADTRNNYGCEYMHYYIFGFDPNHIHIGLWLMLHWQQQHYANRSSTVFTVTGSTS